MSAAARLHDILHHVAPTDGAMLDLAAQCGVKARIARRAYRAIPVGAESHLQLALACGYDPVRRCGCRRLIKPQALQWSMVRGGAFLQRFEAELSQRQAARLIGISYSTLSRVEAGEPVSAESLLDVCAWIKWPASALLIPRAVVESFTGNSHCNTPAQARAA